jgi:RNA polymerase sigma-70 factor, ECF subfamily
VRFPRATEIVASFGEQSYFRSGTKSARDDANFLIDKGGIRFDVNSRITRKGAYGRWEYLGHRPEVIYNTPLAIRTTWPHELSLFPVAARIPDMMLGSAIFGGTAGISSAVAMWGAGVGLDSEIAQLRRGDLDALSSLLARYQNRLYRYLLRMVRQPAEAEDLFQQTWLRVAEKIQSYDQRRNFEAWLFTLARNLAIDHLRRLRPESLDEPLGDSASGETAVTRLVSQDTPAFDRVLARERGSRLADAMETLPMIQREVLTLRFEEEMKLEEIAEILGTPLSTVKTRLRRALEKLREGLETKFPGENWQ